MKFKGKNTKFLSFCFFIESAILWFAFEQAPKFSSKRKTGNIGYSSQMDIHMPDVGTDHPLPDSMSSNVEPEELGASVIPKHPWMLLSSCLSSTSGSMACTLHAFTALAACVLARDSSNTWK